MATSGSTDFLVNCNDIVKYAHRVIGVNKRGMTPAAEDFTEGRFFLNLIAKQWNEPSDGSANMKMWLRKRYVVIPQLNTVEYQLGGTGPYGGFFALDDLASTTLDAAEAAAQTVISVTSTSGMTAGDVIGIYLSSGYWHWSTIVSFVTDDTVTITDALDDPNDGSVGADNGALVYFYTTAPEMPREILTLVRRERNGDDVVMYFMNRSQYDAYPDKDNRGDPVGAHYQEFLAHGLLFLDAGPTDTLDQIRMTALREIEDFDSTVDNPDFPKVWYRALVYQLAKDLAGPYGKEWSQSNEDTRIQAVTTAKYANPETSRDFFQRDLPESWSTTEWLYDRG